MKTTERATLPENVHEQPAHELKLSKWVRYGLYYVAVSLPIGLGWAYFSMFEGIGQPASNQTMEPLIICVAMSLLLYIIGVPAIGLLVGDIYFYDRRVEMRCLFPFAKRKVIYYDKMHVHIRNMGRVLLNHYETPPRFWKSPYTWLKANFIAAMNIALFANPEIQEFLKTKAQSVNAIKTSARAALPTTMQTTLPDNTHEQPVHVFNYPSRQNYQMTSREFTCGFCFMAAMFLFCSVAVWALKVPEFIKVGGLEMVIG